MTVLAAYAWPTNAHLIADVAKLGYLDGHVLDPTYGRGVWWKRWRPEKLTAHDLHMLDGVDFRHLPHPSGTFDAVAFDPPYKLKGTTSARPTAHDDSRYGITAEYRPWRDRHRLIGDGIRECARVLRPGGFLVLKCQDQVCSGAIRWQTVEFTEAARLARLVLVDRFDMLGSHRPQPMEGRKQKHAHGRPSTLLVFRRRD